jgi:hypothetical protein
MPSSPPLSCDYKRHTPSSAAHMIKQYDALQPTACDMTEAMHAVVAAWVTVKRTTPQKKNGDPLTPAYVSGVLSDVKKYLVKLGRKDVAEYMKCEELRGELMKKRNTIVDNNNSTKVAIDFTPYIDRAVEELKLTKRAPDTTRDQYLCRKMAALYVVLRLRKKELLLKTMLTLCEGDNHAVTADRLSKGRSKNAATDTEGCKVGPFRIQIQGTTADVVLWNFTMLREHLSCKGKTAKETRRLCQNTSKRVTLQLRLMFPELVQLYTDKPGSRAFSLHSVRHIGEAFCTTMYKLDTMSRDLYRMQLFHHDDRSVGKHYERFDHVVGAPLPDFKGVPAELYSDSDDDLDSDDYDGDSDSDYEQDDVPDAVQDAVQAVTDTMQSTHNDGDVQSPAEQDNTGNGDGVPDEVNAYVAECDADDAAIEEMEQRALMRKKQEAEDELEKMNIQPRLDKRKYVAMALEGIDKMDLPDAYKDILKLHAVKQRRYI